MDQAIKEAPTVAAVEAKPATPTVDEIVDTYLESEKVATAGWVNIFAECIQGGVVTVTTEDQASEIARRMNTAASELENARAMAAEIIARAEAKVKQLDFLFLTPLEIWTSAKLAGKKTRSLALPGGKLALRKIPASTRYVDQEATVVWAQTHLPSAITMVPKVDADQVKAWEEQNNAVAPGREFTPEHDSFKVSIPK